MELIKTDKEKLRKIKDQIQKDENVVAAMKLEVDKQREPRDTALIQRENLLKSVSTYDKDLMGLRNAKGCLKDLTKRVSQIQLNKQKLD